MKRGRGLSESFSERLGPKFNLVSMGEEGRITSRVSTCQSNGTRSGSCTVPQTISSVTFA